MKVQIVYVISFHICATPHTIKHFMSSCGYFFIVLLPHWLTLQERRNGVPHRNILCEAFFARLILAKTDGDRINIIEAIFKNSFSPVICFKCRVLKAVRRSSLFKLSVTVSISASGSPREPKKFFIKFKKQMWLIYGMYFMIVFDDNVNSRRR